MRVRILSILAALWLSACGGEPAAEKPAASEEPAALESPVMGPERQILAFGDSLFAGYNVAKEDAYPAKLEAALRAQGINAKVTNAAVSGDTTAAGLQRLTFTLNSLERTPDLAILELGGNDLLRGLAPAETRKNLSEVLSELSQRKIPVLIMGMRAPPNLGADFQRQFDAIYPDLAEQYDAALVPFLYEPIYNKPHLIQADRIHPTEQGIEEMVASTSGTVVKALPPSKED